MSWFKAVSYSGDDVFDESGDDLSLQRKEWISNMKKRVRDGFVDGIDAGEEAALQVGFNLGFREGAAQTVAVGRLKGIVSAVWCWCQIGHPEKPVPASVTELLLQVSQYEDKMTDGIRKAFENPPPSVSDVSESMEDLVVEQADQGCCGGGCEKTGCCRKEEKMDLDVSHQPQKPCSGSTDCSSISGEGLTLLLQHTVDVVSELGLPQELISHILERKSLSFCRYPVSSSVTEDSDNGSSSESKRAGSEDLKSHDVSESSPGSEPMGLNHSGEERDSSISVREPETTPPADASESSKFDQNAKPDSECSATSQKEVTSLENTKQDIGEEMMPKVQDKDVPKAKEDDVMNSEAGNAPSGTETQAGNDAEIQEVTEKEEQLAGSTATDVKVEVLPVTEKEDSAEDDLGNSEEDLYRGAEELSVSQSNKPGPPSVFETTLLKVEDRCSLALAVDILSYSEREWKGNTAKSALIRKGYKEMSQRFGSLRRVRGDNYCALRATLFQVLSHSTQLPAWLQEEDITVLLKQLEAQEALISQWTFPGECLQGDETGDVAEQLKGYMELLRKKWQAAVDCSSDVERQQLCERVFQGGEEELGLLEALKLLMLVRAVELHSCMQGGGDVPLFCWLLFARDSSDCPRSFLSNHLSHVGLSAGLEQVEMFLLGYALQCTIEVYRLYKADTEEFVTYYPDDHKDDWPSVCLVTEDDRHYNVPVVEAAELHKELNSS